MPTIEDKAQGLHEAKKSGIAWSDLGETARQKLRDQVASQHQAEETIAILVEATGLTADQVKAAVAGLKKLGYLRELHELDV